MNARVAGVALLTTMAACGAPENGEDGGGRAVEGPVVVATIPPIASLVDFLLGDHGTVRVLLPPGANPDTWEPTARAARDLASAALLVRVGGALDEWPGARDGVPTVRLAEGIDLLRDGHGHEGGTGNPHVWLDPILVRDSLLPRLAEALAAAVPEAAGEIRDRARVFADSLTVLDAEIRGLLGDVETPAFVAAHAAWPYFARRYGLEQVGVVHHSPGREVGTRDLARLVREGRQLGVKAVIAEPQMGRGGVEALAAELGARVEVADPLGGAGMEGREDYLSLMRYNARAFARALGS